jgi:hypothetical protein
VIELEKKKMNEATKDPRRKLLNLMLKAKAKKLREDEEAKTLAESILNGNKNIGVEIEEEK